MATELLALPVELLEKICSFLDPFTLWSLGRCCERLDHVLTNDQIWRQSLRRSFVFEDNDVAARDFFAKNIHHCEPLLGAWLMHFRSSQHVLYVFTEIKNGQNWVVGVEIVPERDRRYHEGFRWLWERKIKGMIVFRFELHEKSWQTSSRAVSGVKSGPTTSTPEPTKETPLAAAAAESGVLPNSASAKVPSYAAPTKSSSAKSASSFASTESTSSEVTSGTGKQSPITTQSHNKNQLAWIGRCVLGLDQYPEINCDGAMRIELLSKNEFHFRCLNGRAHDKKYNDFNFTFTSTHEQFVETFEYINRSAWWQHNYDRWLANRFAFGCTKISTNLDVLDISPMTDFLPAPGFFVSSHPAHGSEMLFVRYQAAKTGSKVTGDDDKNALVGVNVSGTQTASKEDVVFRAFLDQSVCPSAEEQLNLNDFKDVKPVSVELETLPKAYVSPKGFKLPELLIPEVCVGRFAAVVQTEVDERNQPVFSDAQFVVFDQNTLGLLCFECKNLFLLERVDFDTIK